MMRLGGAVCNVIIAKKCIFVVHLMHFAADVDDNLARPALGVCYLLVSAVLHVLFHLNYVGVFLFFSTDFSSQLTVLHFAKMRLKTTSLTVLDLSRDRIV
jgi:hypothetical protein